MSILGTAPAATRLLRLLLIGSIAVPLAVLAGGGYLAWESTRERAEADLMRRVAIAEEHALKVLDTHQLVAARVNDLLGNLGAAVVSDMRGQSGRQNRVLCRQFAQPVFIDCEAGDRL